MATVYSYLRFSDKAQEVGTSFARQRKLAQTWLQKHPEHDPDTKLKMTDLGASAHHKEHLEAALGDFIKKANEGLIEKGSILLLEKLDRFSRFDYQDAWELLRQVVKCGITIITLDPEHEINSKNIKDIGLMIQVMATFFAAEHESEKKSHRLREAWNIRRERSAKEGTKLTCKCPAWLEPVSHLGPLDRVVCTGYRIKPDAQRAIKDIFKWTLDGYGQRQILRQLSATHKPITGHLKRRKINEETNTFEVVEVTTPKWTGAYVQKLLSDRSLLGELQQYRVINGRKRIAIGKPIKDYFPRLISDSVFQKAQYAKSVRRKSRNKNDNFINILSGLVFCSDGYPMHALASRTKRVTGEIYVQRRLTSYGHSLMKPEACPWAIDYFRLEKLVCDAIVEIDESTLISTKPIHKRSNADLIALKKKQIKGYKSVLSTLDDEQTISDVSSLLQDANQELRKLEQDSGSKNSLTKEQHEKNVKGVKNLLAIVDSQEKDKRNDLRYKIQYLLPTVIEKIVLHPRKLPNRRVEADGRIHLVSGEVRNIHLCDYRKHNMYHRFDMKAPRVVAETSHQQVVFIATQDGLVTFSANENFPRSKDEWSSYLNEYVIKKFGGKGSSGVVRVDGIGLDEGVVAEKLDLICVSFFINLMERVEKSDLKW